MNNQLFTCRKCSRAYAVPALDANLRLLKSRMRCPNWMTCKGSIYRGAETNVKPSFHVVMLSAIELYQASMGTGLPEERKCGPKDLKKIMVGSKITEVQLGDAPAANRSLIHSITLDNGKVLHLAPSTKGASVFKITEVRHGR